MSLYDKVLHVPDPSWKNGDDPDDPPVKPPWDPITEDFDEDDYDEGDTLDWYERSKDGV